MMTEAQIQEQIQREHQEYLNKAFSDTLPDWFLLKFGDAIMEVPMAAAENRADTLISIFGKKSPAELTVFEVGVMINVYLATPPKALAKDIKKHLPMRKTLESIFIQWATVQRKEEERLQRKTASMSHEHRQRIIPGNGIGANELRSK